MAFDRKVTWREPVPQRDLVMKTVREYFGVGIEEVAMAQKVGFYFVVGPQESFPVLPPPLSDMTSVAVKDRVRSVEVYFHDNGEGVFVTTRQADDFTMAVADGLADLLRRYYGKPRKKR